MWPMARSPWQPVDDRCLVKLSPTSPTWRSTWNWLPSKETMPAASWPRCWSACRPSAVRAAASGWPKTPKTPHSSWNLSSLGQGHRRLGPPSGRLARRAAHIVRCVRQRATPFMSRPVVSSAAARRVGRPAPDGRALSAGARRFVGAASASSPAAHPRRRVGPGVSRGR